MYRRASIKNSQIPDANLPKTGVRLPEQSHALVHSKGPDKERYLPSL